MSHCYSQSTIATKPWKSIGKLGMRVAEVSADDAPIFFNIKDAVVAFEPSVYGGTGQERRKNILLEIDDSDVQVLQQLEAKCQEESSSKALWSSCVREAGVHSGSCRAKISFTGFNSVAMFDMSGAEVLEAPERWRQLKVNVTLKVRGIYETKQLTGLQVEVAALQFNPEGGSQRMKCPF